MKPTARFGPGFLVAAAFIGPGTITTASLAGAHFGYSILWALVFSIGATIVLQEMSARLGLVTRGGLAEAIRAGSANPVLRALAATVVVAAIALGNAAFEMGNILGAAIGLELLTGIPVRLGALLVGLAAFALLLGGRYRLIERMLVVLVAVMSAAFIITAVMVRPPVGEVLGGMLRPALPEGSLLTVIALIATTVVPYNLFLHASLVCEKWDASVPVGKAIRRARVDIVLAVGLGGMTTLAIVVAVAGAVRPGTSIESASDMALQLEPLLGRGARAIFAFGLVAAGLSSAVTAPLAAAYATTGALGWKPGLSSARFRAVWAVILLVGTGLALVGWEPVRAILFAQAANGLVLPVIAVFLLVAMNRRGRLGEHANGAAFNALGVAVVLVAAGLGVVQFLRVAGALR